MAATTSTIQSRFGTFTITDDDAAPVGTITVTGPAAVALATFQYNARPSVPILDGGGNTIGATPAYYDEHAAAMQTAHACVARKIEDLSETLAMDTAHADSIQIHDDLVVLHNDLVTLHNDFVTQNAIHSDQRDDIRVLKVRGENYDLGIYTHGVLSRDEDIRALIINSLKRSNELQNVLNEKRNPTPPADFLPLRKK